MKFSFKSVLRRLDSALWDMHIPIPNNVQEEILKDKNRRVVITINDAYKHQCALLSKGNGYGFININIEIVRTLNLTIGDELKILLERDTSKYGLPVPKEFEEMIAQDIEGAALFHKLTMGKQRTLLHMIGKPKLSATRIKKAVVIFEFLKNNGGRLDFKALNEAFKLYNSR